MSGLPEYLVQKRAAFRALKDKARAPGYTPSRLEARVRAEGRSGIRRIRVRDFQIISDAGPEFAGYDLGPSSPEIVLGALGSCLTHTYLIQAAVHEVPLTDVQIVVNGQVDGRAGQRGHETIPVYPHDISYTVTLATAATAEEIAALNSAVERSCPILNLIRKGHDVPGRVIVVPTDVPRAAQANASATRVGALSAVGTP